MDDRKSLLGALSALATFGLLTLIAWKTGVFGTVMSELTLFLSGGFHEIRSSNTTFLMMSPVILAVVVLELPSTIAAGALQSMVLGKMKGGHALTDLFREMGEGNHFFTFFIIVLLEELFARWLFLGLLTKIPFLSGTIAFYALFLVGNALWALIHLSNFDEEKDRKVLRVLPQFVAGVFFTYVFVKYGLLAAILAHFASNAVLFATHKVEQFNVIDIGIIGYTLLCGIISYMFMTKPITDIMPWFADVPIFRLEGWGFWDYVTVSVFLSASFAVILDLLLYDKGEAGSGEPSPSLISAALWTPIAIGILYGIYALLGLVIANVPYRILVLAILLTFLKKGASGSAMAQTFWIGLPETYITICILQALGFWPALG